MQLKKIGLTFGTIGVAVAPIATVISCGKKDSEWKTNKEGTYDVKQSFLDNKSNHKNVYTSNDNETDLLTSLGFYPDYANQWSNRNNDDDNFIPNTLKDRLKGLIGSKIKKGPLYDTPNIDGAELIKKDISTVLIDKSDEPDKTKFDGYSDALIYQNSFQGEVGTFTDEKFTLPEINSFGLNVFGGFEGVANAIDKLYDRTDLVSKAQEINDKVQQNIKTLKDAIGNNGSDQNRKKLLILQASTDADGNITFDRLHTVMSYNLLYSNQAIGKGNRGLGFAFPDIPNIKDLKANPWKITATDLTTLAESVKGLADEYIISFDKTDPNFNDATDNAKNSTIKNNFKTKLIDVNKNKDAHIHIVDRDMWKRAAWGIYGTNQLITKTFLNEFTELTTKTHQFIPENEIFTPADKLVQLR